MSGCLLSLLIPPSPPPCLDYTVSSGPLRHCLLQTGSKFLQRYQHKCISDPAPDCPKVKCRVLSTGMKVWPLASLPLGLRSLSCFFRPVRRIYRCPLRLDLPSQTFPYLSKAPGPSRLDSSVPSSRRPSLNICLPSSPSWVWLWCPGSVRAPPSVRAVKAPANPSACRSPPGSGR